MGLILYLELDEVLGTGVIASFTCRLHTGSTGKVPSIASKFRVLVFPTASGETLGSIMHCDVPAVLWVCPES